MVKAKEITKLISELQDPVDTGEMERKAMSWDVMEVKKTPAIGKLPVFFDSGVYGKEIKVTDAPAHLKFKDKKLPQWFILKTKFGQFVVDTEGYDYARYVVKLV